RQGKVYEQEVHFLVVATYEKLAPGEQTFDLRDGKTYRRWRETDRLDLERIKLFKETRLFRRLKAGDRVEKGDLLAVVSQAVPFDDAQVRMAKLDAAQADMLASLKTSAEAERRYYRDRALRTSAP